MHYSLPSLTCGISFSIHSLLFPSMHYSLLYFSFHVSFSIWFWLINLHALQSSISLLWCHILNICSSRHVFYLTCLPCHFLFYSLSPFPIIHSLLFQSRLFLLCCFKSTLLLFSHSLLFSSILISMMEKKQLAMGVSELQNPDSKVCGNHCTTKSFLRLRKKIPSRGGGGVGSYSYLLSEIFFFGTKISDMLGVGVCASIWGANSFQQFVHNLSWVHRIFWLSGLRTLDIYIYHI